MIGMNAEGTGNAVHPMDRLNKTPLQTESFVTALLSVQAFREEAEEQSKNLKAHASNVETLLNHRLQAIEDSLVRAIDLSRDPEVVIPDIMKQEGSIKQIRLT